MVASAFIGYVDYYVTKKYAANSNIMLLQLSQKWDVVLYNYLLSLVV